MTRIELEHLLWKSYLTWYDDVCIKHEQNYTQEPIIVIINNEAIEIEYDWIEITNNLNGCFIEDIITYKRLTTYEIKTINWLNYSENFWHFDVDFNEFCKDNNIL